MIKTHIKTVCLFLFSIFPLTETMTAQSTQKVASGRIDHITNFPSKYVEARNIDVWLPENYNGKKKFSVLYMHDGQMLYDASTTWNKQAWDVDDIAARLIHEGKIKNVIIVGIWNSNKYRHQDYFPQKPFEQLTDIQKDTVLSQLAKTSADWADFKPNSDNYLRFIVEEVKPMIDKKYKVHKNRKHTFIAGSSMGGLISWYALCEYPKIFGGAACLSTHWIGSFQSKNNPIPDAFIGYLKEKLPKVKRNKIYFDTGDQTLDVYYPEIQKKVDELMQNSGFTTKNWVTRYFTNKNHSENAWRERVDIPLLFLLER